MPNGSWRWRRRSSDAQRLEVAGAIRRAYVTLALARRDLLAAFETGRALEQLVDLAQTTYAAGSGSQVAVVKALLEVTRLQERIALLAGEERMGVARLNTLLGRAPDAAIGALEEPRADTPTGGREQPRQTGPSTATPTCVPRGQP